MTGKITDLSTAPRSTRSRIHRAAWWGVAGAVLTGIGDVLMLGRMVSGADFAEGVGVAPIFADAEVVASFWNGVDVGTGRVWWGALIGVVGIGVLERYGLSTLVGDLRSAVLRTVGRAAVTVFAVFGVAVHFAFGPLLLGYRQAAVAGAATWSRTAAPLADATDLVMLGGVASLGALAVVSAALAVGLFRDRAPLPRWTALATPIVLVVAALLVAGRLPSPVGGLVYPAWISAGMLVFFVLVAGCSGERADLRRDRRTGSR
ncbi:MAG: DUF6796 family protein [Dermatophilaceae bacterium]